MWFGDSLFKGRNQENRLGGERWELERRELHLSWVKTVWMEGDLERLLLQGFALEGAFESYLLWGERRFR